MNKEYEGFKDIIGKRKVWFTFSLIIILAGIVSIAMPQRRLNVGIDFTGGYLIQYPTERKVTTSEVEKIVNETGIKYKPVQVMYGGKEFLLRTEGNKKNAMKDERDEFYAKMKDLKIKFRLAFTDVKQPYIDLRFMDAVPSQKKIEDAISKSKISGVSVEEITSTRNEQKEGENQTYNVKVKLAGADDKDTFDKAVTAVYKELNGFELTTEKGETEVDPLFSAELFRRAALALIIAVIGILIYITLRFEFWFAVAGIVALVHDCCIIIGLYSILQLEVDASFVAVILTVVGYSINDTIIILDRIRENSRKDRKTPLHQLFNFSLWETMTRSVYTILTVVITLLAIILFGGSSVQQFSIGLLIGIVFGGYSSIFIAAPCAFMFKTMAGKDDRAALAAQQQIPSKKKEKKEKAEAATAAQASKSPAASAGAAPEQRKASSASDDAKKKDQKKGKQRRR